MRKYIRHPTDIPIKYKIEENDPHKDEFLKNIGHGGLCFQSKKCIPKGTELIIHIPIRKPEFIIKGLVLWCKELDKGYEVGIKFMDVHSEYRVRMVEQICYIEHYRREVLVTEGRKLSHTEAAKEWIEKFANDFPG